MTSVEMQARWDEYCDSHDSCDSCVLNDFCETVYGEADDAQLRTAMKIIDQAENRDNVTHPKHYNRDGAMECLDEMLLIFGKETVMNFCLCNTWKYRYRATDKNHEEDIAKSDFYMKKYKELHDDILFT